MLLFNLKRSKLHKLSRYIKYLRIIKEHDLHIHFRTKLQITIFGMAAYLLLLNTRIYALNIEVIPEIELHSALWGASTGSLISFGIGPWVTSSIMLTLFIKTGIFKLDLKQKEDKDLHLLLEYYFLPIIFSILYSLGYCWVIIGNPIQYPIEFFILTIQLVIGTYILMTLADLIDNFGIGKGINWFLALGISTVIFWQLFSMSSHPIYSEQLVGAFPDFFSSLFQSTPRFSRMGPSIIGAWFLLMFLIIGCYFEGSRVELPLAHGRVRGARGRYPIKILYAGNKPAILAWSVMVNMIYVDAMLKYFNINMNISWIFTPPAHFDGTTQVIRAIIYSFISISLCIIFSKFWVDITGIGTSEVAKSIQKSGMQIPGFRRDPRVLKKVLERYIPVVTFLSGFFTGLFGVLNFFGNPVAGTMSFLLITTIIMNYEAIGKEQLIEMHPILGGFYNEGECK